ncbi:hypothetical protein HKD37_01G002032 [Glycine soja]
MDNTLWELLDIDDSNLSSFVYPSNPNQLSFSLRPLIPSPIGVIQVVKVNHQSRKPLPIQEFIMCAHPESQPGFNKNPWLCALEFVRSQGSVNTDDTPHGTKLGSIDYTFDRVSLTTVIVKTCTPNYFGNMRVTLKVVKHN